MELWEIPVHRPISGYWKQISIGSIRPTTLSDPDSQTDPHQARSIWRSCNATPFSWSQYWFCRRKGWYALSVTLVSSFRRSQRCSCRIIRDCRIYRSSHVGYRFGRSGSSGFVVDFRLLCWSGCVPVPRGCAYRTWPTSGMEVSCGLRLATLYVSLSLSELSGQRFLYKKKVVWKSFHTTM